MALPCVLFSSSASDFNPNSLIKKILNTEELPKPRLTADIIECYTWSFENKYYKATIDLCSTNSRTIGNEAFAESVEAFINYFDPKEKESFNLVKAWMPYLEHIDPELKILVCERCSESDVISRKQTLEWCIENGFELVELSPDTEVDEDDDFPETLGMDRIIQAFNAHTWPNLEMKDTPQIQSPLVRQLMKEQHLLNLQDSNNSKISGKETNQSFSSTKYSESPENNPQSKSQAISAENIAVKTSDVTTDCQAKSTGNSAASNVKQTDSSNESNINADEPAQPSDSHPLPGLDDINWGALLTDSVETDATNQSEADLEVEEFERLFMKLKVMKDKAETLPEAERRQYAEKVAVSFWKAVGGDEDEILGLDDLDD